MAKKSNKIMPRYFYYAISNERGYINDILKELQAGCKIISAVGTKYQVHYILKGSSTNKDLK